MLRLFKKRKRESPKIIHTSHRIFHYTNDTNKTSRFQMISIFGTLLKPDFLMTPTSATTTLAHYVVKYPTCLFVTRDLELHDGNATDVDQSEMSFTRSHLPAGYN